MKNSKGITLIALVVTIVVLLILAAVSIQMLGGENGIIKQAQNAKEETRGASVEETRDLWVIDMQSDQLLESDNAQTLDELLNDLLEKSLITQDEKTQIKEEGYVIIGSRNIQFKEIIDFDEVLNDLTNNKDKYYDIAEDKGQSSTNKDLGIGTNGDVVNLDLWTYEKSRSQEGMELGINGVCSWEPGYDNSNIINGKIQGTVPQYIYLYEDDKIYAVTEMAATFSNCINLVTAPEIPETVTNMYYTFYECTNLETASLIPTGVTNLYATFSGCTSLVTAPPAIPSSVTNLYATFKDCTSLVTAPPAIPSSVTNVESAFYNCTSLVTAPAIPSSVTNLRYTFYNCTSLKGDLIINTNTSNVYNCLNGAGSSTEKLYLTGTSTTLEEILATATNENVLLK